MDKAEEPVEEEENGGWWSRLKQGLKRSSDRLGDGLKTIFVSRKLDQKTLDELEELLITSDLGVETAARLTGELAKQRLNQDVTLEEVKAFLANAIEVILDPVAQPLLPDQTRKPHVVLVVGVNGGGKTTTMGKLARQWKNQGLSVMMAAGDTFRAAAVEQLQVWGQRLGVPVVSGASGADAAGLAYDALLQAQQAGADVLLVDTAGRLQNKAHLMEELKKIQRVLTKLDATAPQSTLLILDGTTGQNAHSQVQTFQEMIGLTGLIITKLDGTARGGVVVSIAQKFGLPIHAIGVGESADDLRPFTARDFARNLLGLES
ncbi:MAG: signal recognition particle-docking protein FtsY [Alphaproteobacteria bacterium]|jgi:fused signal recognition particle receptor|nr:signal recognition particle-docking protein FtsY [Alphaproteobacteria bacterium]MDF3034477.1 signal recognition particle-docking protein FtsY [Alphaproteobacteria bacterium]